MYQVLVADDEMIERRALVRRLRKHFGDSCRFSEAGNGSEAVRICRETKAQIVILDIAMPGMNGVEAAEEIRRTDKDCSIIFLTAYDDFAYTRKAIIVRALDYLLKPCDENELTAVMEEAMRLADVRTEAERISESQAGAERAQDALAGAERTPEGEAGAESMRHALSEAEKTPEPSSFEASTGELRMNQVAQAMRQYIREHYMKEISMQDAARALNYSDVYFCKLFKQCFDQNFTSYLAQFRITRAKALLADPSVNVKEAGMRVGYADPNYFAKVFKRLTGMIPSEYKNGHCAQKMTR